MQPGSTTFDRQTDGERLAFALLTSVLVDEMDEARQLVGEITDDLPTNVEAISTLLRVIRLQLSWQAGQADTTSLAILGALAEAFALDAALVPAPDVDDQADALTHDLWGPET